MMDPGRATGAMVAASLYRMGADGERGTFQLTNAHIRRGQAFRAVAEAVAPSAGDVCEHDVGTHQCEHCNPWGAS